MSRRRVGRYVIFEAFARGGMATVHLGRLIADRGFSRLVAVKMLTRGQSSSVYARALEEEARIASRIRHPNVVQSLDFVVDGDDFLVVMEYVHGVPLSQLVAAARSTGEPMPSPVSVAVISEVLNGLHAAHEAADERGRPLGVVHRDVSPQNVLVGADGIARLADFGIAKVIGRARMSGGSEQTETGTVKGKLAYMPPEQLRGLPLTRQADIFSAGAVLAEALSGVGPDARDEDPTAWLALAVKAIKDPALLDVVRIATRSDARDRFATAAEMGEALANAAVRARAEAVADRVTALAGDDLEIRSELVRRVEAAPLDEDVVPLRDDDDDESAPITPPVFPMLATESNVRGETTIETIEPIEILERAPHPRPPPPPPSIKPSARSRPPSPLFLFFVGAALVVIATVAYTRFARDDAAPSSSPPSTPPVWPVAPSISVPAATPSSPSSPPSPPSPPPPTIPSRSKTLPPTPPPPPPPPPTKPRPTKPDCNPPFRIDADGNKHYKPECT
jgi:serine/threonine protein kinase